MANKKSSSSATVAHYKKHLLPSLAGGGVAYLITGVVILGVVVFATVWLSNMLNHHLHKNK